MKLMRPWSAAASMPGHSPGGAYPLSSEPRHHSGTARDVQYALARLRISECNDERCPRCEDSGNKGVLVCLGGSSSYLPLSLVSHRLSPDSD